MARQIKPIDQNDDVHLSLFKEIRALIVAARNTVVRNINAIQAIDAPVFSYIWQPNWSDVIWPIAKNADNICAISEMPDGFWQIVNFANAICEIAKTEKSSRKCTLSAVKKMRQKPIEWCREEKAKKAEQSSSKKAEKAYG